MPFFKTSDGCRLFYEIRTENTDRPFVVFLNGFTQTTVYWYGRVPVFKKNFSILLYDARGQGQSELGKVELSLDRHALDLHELLTQLKIKRPHLISLSHGARVALRYGDTYPANINRLVLCGLGARDSQQIKRIVSSWESILATGDPADMAKKILPVIFGKRFFEHYKDIMNDIAAAVVERNQKDALLAQLRALPHYPPPESARLKSDVDSLVLSGSEDQLVPPSAAAELASHIAGRHELLDDVGHSLPVEAPGRFDLLVLEFLSRPLTHP
jgi:3-oxoadipate enol-lactonase